jgi:DNA-binding GntR family transcriptional regulator
MDPKNAIWSLGNDRLTRSPRRLGSTVSGQDGYALVDHIAATLQARVLRGEIPSGARLRQEMLAAEFEVSRTPVREALRKLQADGIVELEPHRGAVVRKPDAREIREAYEVRAELEGFAAELAAERIQAQQLARLHEAARLFRLSIDELHAHRRAGGDGVPDAIQDWTHANDVFHLAVLDAAGNERLRRTLADLHRTIPRDLTSIVLGENSRLLEENIEQHSAILAAIEQLDPVAARRAMVEHVLSAGALVTLRFEQRSA